MNDKKILLTIAWLLLVVCAAPLLHYGRRALITDRFVIKGVSMEPTLHTGQGVWVNKLLMGPRIYTKFDFDSSELHCIRLPGLRRLRVGDVAVFNYPYGHGGDSIAFKINYVYCKRCWGTPGDTVRIVGGIETPDSVLLRMRMLRAGQFAGERDNWTTKDFGPIVVPKRGMTIVLDSVSRRHYARVMAWEEKSAAGRSRRMAEGTYTFRQDWYFFVGDNVTNSRDSRFFGFVPADFVVGIVPGK